MFGASFVGRSADLDAVGALLAERRLVSVVGEGGVGKTPLVTATAAAQREQGQQVAWADLAAARTPAGVVADAAVTLVVTVDRACPDVHVLTTTRERLGVAGEVVHRLQPLALPVSGSTPAEATQAPAVALLTDRIRDVLGDFRVDDANVQIWADLDEADRVVRQSGDGGFHVDFLDTRRAALMSHSRSIPAGTELDAAVVARSAPLTRMALTGLVFQAYGPALMDLRLDHRLAIAREALSQSRVVGYPVTR